MSTATTTQDGFLLSFSSVEPTPPATFVKTAVLLHGVLGSGQNFRGFARKLLQLRPDYRFLLADLRHHGGSQGAPPPDTLSACAEDVERLGQRLGNGPSPDVVIGHSFGGKVAIELLRRRETGAPGSMPLRQVWALDANPGTQDVGAGGEVQRVIQAVRAVPLPLSERQQLVSALTEQGLSTGLAQWMTTNLKREPDGYHWVFNLDRIETLLNDYYSRDLWDFLTQRSAPSADLHIVVADQSERFDGAMRARVQQLEARGTARYHLIENAGHWLHVDNPGALQKLLSQNLP
jgi:esterase